jgi:AAA15 family ATPase/GTPase
MISSCEIRNFRYFKKLHQEGLKRLTFLVGGSGSGKTCHSPKLCKAINLIP